MAKMIQMIQWTKLVKRVKCARVFVELFRINKNKKISNKKSEREKNESQSYGYPDGTKLSVVLPNPLAQKFFSEKKKIDA